MCTFLQLLQLQSPRQRGQGQACSWLTCAPAQHQRLLRHSARTAARRPGTHRLDILSVAVQQAPGAPVQRALAALCLHLHRLLPALVRPDTDCQPASADDITITTSRRRPVKAHLVARGAILAVVYAPALRECAKGRIVST